MNQFSAHEIKQNTLSIFKYWSCTLLLVLLPADFLYRIDSFLRSFTLTTIAVDASLLGLVLGFAAAVIALAVGLISTLLGLFSKTLGQLTLAINNVVVWLFADLVFFIYLNLWSATVVPEGQNTLRRITVIGIFLLFNIFMATKLKQMPVIVNRAFKVIPVFAAVSALLLVLKLAAVSLYAGPTPPVKSASTSKLNVILVTFDALSASDMSLYGYPRDTTPNMNEFARSAFIFDRMYSNSNHTSPSVCSILTSKYPTQHKVYNNFMVLTEEARRDNLCATLKKNGYTTAAVVANPAAHPWHNRSYPDFSYVAPVPYVSDYVSGWCYNTFTPKLLKLDSNINNWFYSMKGVVVYTAYKYFFKYLVLAPPMQAEWHDLFLVGNKGWNTRVMNPPERTFEEASKFLNARKEGPFFLWIHVFTPHAPYLPPEKYKYSFLKQKLYDTAVSQNTIYGMNYDLKDQPRIDVLRARYDELILYTDSEFGLFVKKLEKDGYLENTAVFVSADHGEIFEKGQQSHGGDRLNQPLIHIPLVVRLPGQKGSSRIRQNIQQVDLAPTILATVGIPTPAEMQGKSFMGLLRGGQRQEQRIFSMNLEQNYQKAVVKSGTIGVVDGNYKYVRNLQTGKEELYNLEKDPNENSSLAVQDAVLAARMNRLISTELLFDRGNGAGH
ncbi:sulfatase-like hydrolase/transferase [Geomonas oryzisoli]|uniref:Sulfatase-like hydrolase/transferase n=1 Tax=Geomonas oryzisoli TaxID=2847992 RepID=A0ABX8J4D4_9BACT|nr:sulfatase-like hydrolase/transferase [Geomonas oryzisoli]QWV91961.1 sulfatase-like hydrolase/transferase [Geomonas oryzisoli]